MLGTRADAEDVLQDAWLRWSKADQSELKSAEAWLVTVAWTCFREEDAVELPVGVQGERMFLFVSFEGDKFDSYMWFRSRAEPVK